MSLPPRRLRSTRLVALEVSALVSISVLIVTQPSSAAGAAPHFHDRAVLRSDSQAQHSGFSARLGPEFPADVADGERAAEGDEDAAWSWPVGPSHSILRPFIAPQTTYSAGHRGIDVQADDGAVVTAVDAGVVHFAGTVVDRALVSVRHSDGLISSIEPITPLVVEGQTVARGAVIGHVASGHCARTCVHLGVRLHGEYVSPLKYLGGLRPAVLLPTRGRSE